MTNDMHYKIRNTIMMALLEYRCTWEGRRTDEKHGTLSLQVQELVDEQQREIDASLGWMRTYGNSDLPKVDIEEKFSIKGKGTVVCARKFDGWETIKEFESIGRISGKYKVLEAESFGRSWSGEESVNCGFIVEEIK
jgi:hypothetical protein